MFWRMNARTHRPTYSNDREQGVGRPPSSVPYGRQLPQYPVQADLHDMYILLFTHVRRL